LITTLSTGASGIHIDCSAQRTKAIGKAADSFSSAVKPVMLAREYDTMNENRRRCHEHHDRAQDN